MSERDDILRDVREAAREAGFTEPPPLVQVTGTWYRIDSLDAAWAEAEAALPESKGRWGFSIHSLAYTTRGWTATAAGSQTGEWIEASAATPAAALRALASRLKERAG